METRLIIKALTRSLNWPRIIKAVVLVILAATVISYWLDKYGAGDEGYGEEIAADEQACNVTGLEARGQLVTYISPAGSDSEEIGAAGQTASEDLTYAIAEAIEDPDTKAILLEIDSYGGSPVAAEETVNAIRQSAKPVVALIRDAAASAAYWVASAADYIIASPSSDVGSIGVTFSYTDQSKKNAQEGITYNQLTAGEFKDLGNSDKSLTPAERALVERDLDLIQELFVKSVAAFRDIPEAEVWKLADGSSMLGRMALQHKLVDEVGWLSDAEAYLGEKIGERPVICWQGPR